MASYPPRQYEEGKSPIQKKSINHGSIKVVNYEGTGYTLHGCVHALFIWVFESVPGLAELYGNRRETSPGPPLLNWIGSRPRFLFRDFITDEKIEHGEVRVRHMVPVALHDMYPKWSDDDANNRDPLLHKLIEDIIEDRLDPNGWPAVERVKKQKNSLPAKKKKIKRSEQQSEDSGEEKKFLHAKKKNKKIKGVDLNSEDSGEEKESLPAKKKKVKISEQDSEDSGEEKESLPAKKKKVKISEQDSELLTMLKTINGTLANLGTQVGNIDGKINLVDQTCKTKFAKMEEAIKQLQEGEVKGQADEVNSKTSTSWMVVETKGILQDPDDIPLKQVVKNIASVKRGRKIEEMKKVVVKKEKEVVKKHEKAKKQNIDYGSDIEDVTEKHFIEEHTMASSGDEEDIADKAVKNVVASLHSNLLDDTTPLTKRVPKLANSQKLPYIGNSTVKRIIPGVITSLYDYDPMEMVEESKLRKLMEYINDDEEQPLGSVNTNVKFYKEIITPRDQWPKDDYGWLRDSHMDDAMTMFRKRSMRKDSPFRKRVGFMDQWFSSMMVSDFKNYNKKTFMFHESYMDHFNGTAPRHSATEKRWWFEIDNLYACVSVKGDHWIALDINFPRKKIYVYDSIPTHAIDADIYTACQPFRKMLPALLNVMVPDADRQKNTSMFEIYRLKTGVPRNVITGDCGVYTLKYIECLALGWEFDGLNDENIQALRERLGAEMFEEVPPTGEVALTNPLPRRAEFEIPSISSNFLPQAIFLLHG
ncbi:unnamed protein product [Arabidopsis arenosa]|uniref:Ubiquitin-like protease family profile domain-containing protein n=1 Tax=Arabidopsis arenosa TaxID=38785 RepID=A0A8S2ARA1_ARAAE|nr:unnamed protein product [Arabidopsis arenosa]CAE6140246.1 unnamed protein product [Arabidopsis arenosa]